MIDYGPGDAIVYIKNGHSAFPDIKSGSIWICQDIYSQEVVTQDEEFCCPECGEYALEVVLYGVPIHPDWALCPCDFRKKLDFKKLCNVDETTKIKEDA